MNSVLAQVNVGRLRAPAESAQIAEFIGALDEINALADRAPGFLYRHRSDAAGELIFAEDDADPLMVLNLSVWVDYEHLHDYVFRTSHLHYLRRRTEWFERLDDVVTALWWVPRGTRPTPAQALVRLDELRRNGPTAQAFSMRERFTADGLPEERMPLRGIRMPPADAHARMSP